MTDPTATGLYAQQHHAPGAVLAGRFRIEGLLGVGGMGMVYRATDLALEVPVALKLLRPELAARPEAFERFRQELLLARQVSSPHVVRIHDLAQHEGQWLISMDYIDGEGLDRRLDREGAMPADAAVAIARQLAQGLAAAHARGVIHRDLKPANVLLDREGNAYISDFGVARSLAGAGLTQSGAVIGTPDYLSPEQARGDAIDARSDLYALGLILYEMLTGQMPFQGGTLGEILAQRMLRPPPPVTSLKPGTPAWVARLVDRLLRVQPGHRLPDAQAVVHAIDTRSVPRDWRAMRGHAVIAAALVVALGGAGYAAWYWNRPVAPAPAAPAAVAPLHRLLVLPVQAPEEVGPARAAALAALLRSALADAAGVAVVDGERTQQALRQLDPTGNAPITAVALQRTANADRALLVTLQREGSRWVASASLEEEGAGLQAGDADPVDAFARLVADPAFARLVDPKLTTLTLPLPECPSACRTKALEDYGTGVQALQRGAPAQAVKPLQQVTTAAPGFSPAWLALADAAQAIGEIDLAYEAIERGQSTAPQGPLQPRLAAERALLDGDAPTAAAHWRNVLVRTPDDAWAQLAQARALGAGGDFRGAIGVLDKLVARDPNDPRAWYELGKFSILAGQAQRAVDEYLVRALVLYNRGANRYGAGEATNALGIGYARLGQSAEAEEQYRKAVDIRRAVGNRRGLATSLRNLGNILSQRGKFDEAAAVLKQAGELHAALDDRAGQAAVENELGVLAEERGDFPQALAAFRRALVTWQQLGEKPGIAQALNDIGFAHYQLGAYDDAQAYWTQAAGVYAGLGDDTGQVRTQQNLGLLAIARGQWNDARRQLDGSLRTAEQQQMVEEVAVSRRNLAELELQQGHLDAAVTQAEKAMALFREREDWRGLADAGLLQVQALLAAHADTDARQAAATLASAVEQASTEQRGMYELLRAEFAERANMPRERDETLAKAAQLAQASGVRQLQLLVALHRGGDTGSLKTQIDGLGNVPLRLQWYRVRLAQLGDATRATDAAALYRQALPLLRRGDSLQAWNLHELGARALARSDAGASRLAHQQSCRALAGFVAQLPRRTGDKASDFAKSARAAGDPVPDC